MKKITKAMQKMVLSLAWSVGDNVGNPLKAFQMKTEIGAFTHEKSLANLNIKMVALAEELDRVLPHGWGCAIESDYTDLMHEMEHANGGEF